MTPFDEATLRLKQQLRCTLDKQVAAELLMTAAAWSIRKARGSFPAKEVFALAARHPELGIDPHWVVDGDKKQPDSAAATSRRIHATLTRCRFDNSLVVLNSAPFNGMEIRPADLRHMAQQLTHLADMASLLPTAGKHFIPVNVHLDADCKVTNNIK
ncbi:helix-turn-helix domain-containing protein [Ralstonia syzygii subsp. celebesensis]|uniref:helix-turn-helix domain-containing protein n=1 Tax=Ralstonia syzygii TaxID=28097 RepID=UPI00387E05EA